MQRNTIVTQPEDMNIMPSETDAATKTVSDRVGNQNLRSNNMA